MALVTTEFGGPCASVRQGGDVWVCRHGKSEDARVLEARPLVVIDPENNEQVERLESLYLADKHDKCDNTSDCMADALREFANPQPPKPDEPTGLGAVVEDADGRRWVRNGSTGYLNDPNWRAASPLNAVRKWHTYANINAVKVLSEGVQS